jgi:hypothetical protein
LDLFHNAWPIHAIIQQYLKNTSEKARVASKQHLARTRALLPTPPAAPTLPAQLGKASTTSKQGSAKHDKKKSAINIPEIQSAARVSNSDTSLQGKTKVKLAAKDKQVENIAAAAPVHHIPLLIF